MGFLQKFIRQWIINYRLKPTRQALKSSQNKVYQIKGPVLAYNQKMVDKRKHLKKTFDSLVDRLHKHTKSRDEFIYLTLIYFSSIGRYMVKKAPDWLNNWGLEFEKLGYSDIAENYIEHAKEEMGHDKWHKMDVQNLIKIYNEKFNRSLNVDNILNEGNRNCVKTYTTLSEQVTGGKNCYLSLAELYETEIMAMDLAPNFIAYCVKEVGFDVLKGLKFLNGHVVADVEHIEDNIVQMDRFLKSNPDKVDDLVTIGNSTIDIYIDYFTDALDLAEETLNSQKIKSNKSA
ncbi:MAG: hypothetical protein KDD58_06150 [Bdellovibrionales bacterium]|nr:hypothetical protein [Bdellovibrionales bacterium]